MKKSIKFSATLIFMLIGSVFISEYFSIANAHLNGAPQGAAGDPANGNQTCRSCHFGAPPTFKAGLIQTNVPNAGYTPGTTYVITAGIVGNLATVFGFEVTSEDSTGKFLGTLVSSDNTTALIPTNSSDNNKYITHTYASNFSATHSETWIFKWTAPPRGSGTVTLYGTFMVANGDGYPSYDTLYTSTTAIRENNSIISSIDQFNNMEDNMVLYPNPTKDELTVSYKEQNAENIQLKFIDLNGKTVKQIDNIRNDQPIYVGDLAIGEYTLYIQNKEKIVLKKIVKN